jgi:uncharacterized protein (TIGR02118 family)
MLASTKHKHYIMIKFIFLYNNPTDMAFFDFCQTNPVLPSAAKIKGAVKFDIFQCKTGKDKVNPKQNHMPKVYFSNPAGLKKVLDASGTKAAAEDIANFTSSEVVLIQGCVN